MGGRTSAASKNKWMDDQVTAAGISLSKVLQEALKARLSAE